MKRKILLSTSVIFLIFIVFQTSFLLNFKTENENTKTNQSRNVTPKLSQKQDIQQDSIDVVLEFPATCFAPDTDPSIIEQYYNSRNAKANSLGLTQEDLTNRFNLTNRWLSTAIDGGGLGQGDNTTLTWSYVEDGTPIGDGGCGVDGESTDPSDFIAFFNGIYGPPTTPGDYTTAPWHQVFIDMFASWSEVSGLTFVYEPNDDGATVVTGGSGITGRRGDLRISGRPLDGNSGVLACNYFPQIGDMIIDTSDGFFPANPGLGTTNVLTHEIGHGLGILHVCPVEETKLMEPFVSLAFQGPQEDDILATNRSYGDPEGENDTPGTATILGSNPNPTSYTKLQRSIDDNLDIDYYSFNVSETSTITAVLTPTGTSYLDGEQNPFTGACSPGSNFNALTVSDLMLEVLDTNGTSVLATADSNGLGVTENLLTTIVASGTYFVRVQQQGTAVDNVQMYDLDLSLEAGSCTTANIPVNLQASSITDSSAQLSWDAQSSVLYDLRYRESGTSPWIDISDLVASSTTLSGLTELTEYEAQVRSKCPGDTPTAYSSSVFFTTLEFVLEYCDSASTSTDPAAIYHIGNVTLNTINNNSTESAYTDFTNISTTLEERQSYTITVTTTANNPSFNTRYAVWIDYNLNGSFEDAGEQIFTFDGVAEDLASGQFTIPSGIDPVTTRMRVTLKNGDGIPGSCETFSFGEVEDYTININSAPPCTVFEDFESGLPTGWSTVINTGTCDWANQSATPLGDDFPTLAMVFDDDACGSGAPASNVSLLSDVYDTSGASSLLISYDVAFKIVGSGETLNVEVWDGSTWQEIVSYNANLNPDIQTQANIDATAFANSNFQVRWTYDDGGGWAWHAGIDNFCMTLSTNIWEGTISTDWNTPDNWSLGTVPTSTDSAVIQDVPNQPLIDNSTTAEVDNLIINSNTVVSVEGVLQVSGDITNDGDIVFNSSELLGTGQFDTFSGTITGAGEVTVERYIPAGSPDLRRAYRLLTSAVNSTESINANWQEGAVTTELGNGNPNPGFGTHITGGDVENGFDQNGSGAPSMFTFNNALPSGSDQNSGWTILPDTNVKTLKAGEAYLTFIRGDRSANLNDVNTTPTNTTLRATGSLHTGQRIFSSANNAAALEYGLSNVENFFSLVGNPYQAIVNINNLDFVNVNTNHYWVWDPNLADRGGYATVNLSDGSNNTTSPANEFVQPGQSFFVQTDANGLASLTFNENDKVVTGGATAVFIQEPQPSIKLLLYKTSAYNTGKREADGTLINFSDNGNNELDQFDADKLQGPDESLARLHSNELVSIEHRAMPTDNDILQLSTMGYTADDYTFVVNASQIQDNFDVYLLDTYTGIQTPLNEGTTAVSFSVDPNIPESIAEDRFSLVFDNTTLSTQENTFGAEFSLYPNPTRDGLFSIKTPGLSGEVNVQITNMLGQQVLNEKLSTLGNEVNVDAGDLSTGVYLVELSQNDNKFISKLIIK